MRVLGGGITPIHQLVSQADIMLADHEVIAGAFYPPILLTASYLAQVLRRVGLTVMLFIDGYLMSSYLITTHIHSQRVSLLWTTVQPILTNVLSN